MSAQRSLWDQWDTASERAIDPQTTAKELTQRRTIKRLRASGHWLTLLRVARTIPQPFTLNDISVAVWRNCPEFFGMKGYPYPDNHKVHYILYGDRGLIAKGLIRRVSEGLFRVPDELDVEALAQSETDYDVTSHRKIGGQ
jgi:hypothetical protein